MSKKYIPWGLGSCPGPALVSLGCIDMLFNFDALQTVTFMISACVQVNFGRGEVLDRSALTVPEKERRERGKMHQSSDGKWT